MKDVPKTDLLISIVSHNESSNVKELLSCIEKYGHNKTAVVVTLNVDEQLPFSEYDFPFQVSVVRNKRPKGYGTNHNFAFSRLKSKYFCVLNADARFFEDPFSELIKILEGEVAGVVAPVAYDRNGHLQDSARELPSPWKLLQRLLFKKIDYSPSPSICYVDWIAGFFMLFDSELFRKLSGFDEKYYLYCEDVDICSRIWLYGRKVAWSGAVAIYHDARRSSHGQLNYLMQHVRSMLRLFCSEVYYKRFYQKCRIYIEQKNRKILQ